MGDLFFTFRLLNEGAKITADRHGNVSICRKKGSSLNTYNAGQRALTGWNVRGVLGKFPHLIDRLAIDGQPPNVPAYHCMASAET